MALGGHRERGVPPILQRSCLSEWATAHADAPNCPTPTNVLTSGGIVRLKRAVPRTAEVLEEDLKGRLPPPISPEGVRSAGAVSRNEVPSVCLGTA